VGGEWKNKQKKKKGKEGNCGSNTMAACDELKKCYLRRTTRTNNDNKQTTTTDKQTTTTDKQKTENQKKKAKPSFGVFIKFSSRNVSL